ncbi:unnamed protein product [Boreogadus saida]
MAAVKPNLEDRVFGSAPKPLGFTVGYVRAAPPAGLWQRGQPAPCLVHETVHPSTQRPAICSRHPATPPRYLPSATNISSHYPDVASQLRRDPLARQPL